MTEPSMKRAAISRRQALPLIGLVAVAVGSCEFDVEPLAPDTPREDWLTKARVHRGGIERFALLTRTEGVSVRVEPDPMAGPGAMVLTVLQRTTPEGTRQGDSRPPLVLEVHRGVTEATISQIESPHVVFYYMH